MAAERSRASLPVLFSVVVVDLIGFGIVIPVLPFLAETYGASATVLGALLTSYAVMQALFAPIWGRVSDRFGRRPVMLATIAGSSLALLLLGLADSLVGLFVARTLGGIFGANISVATAYVTDVTSEEQRTTWMGMIGASFASRSATASERRRASGRLGCSGTASCAGSAWATSPSRSG
jgi:MFS family permease